MTALERAGKWFLHSGIQEPEGGVARYYRSDLARNARVSTEITGYSVSFLVYAHQLLDREEYLAAARKAAHFLTRHAWNADLGLFPFEHSFNCSQPEPLAFFFDSGIITRGLLAIWRVTREQEFLDIAVQTGRGMLAHFLTTDTLHPILKLPAREALPYEPRWSASPGCYQLKSAMAWRDLFEVTGERAFDQAYSTALERALANNPVFLPGDPSSEKVMDRLHAYSYFLEGLLPVADRPECAQAIRGGIERLSGYLREIAPAFARSDVYGQLLRVRLFASELGIAPLDEAAACREAEQAATFQYAFHPEAKHSGGFGFGTRGGQPLPYVNPVSTAFCAQALAMWQDHLHRRSHTGLPALV